MKLFWMSQLLMSTDGSYVDEDHFVIFVPQFHTV
jgi:hypothetical protein